MSSVAHVGSTVLSRIALFGHDRPWTALALAGAVSVAAAIGASRVGVDSDLLALLPEQFPSVQAIHQVEERLGGLGWIIVVGEGSDPESLRKFADDLAPKLAALPDVEFVDARRQTDFFEERALLYLPVAELEKLTDTVQARISYEKHKRNPMYVDLEDEAPPALDADEVRHAFASSQAARLAHGGDRTHYLDPARRMVAVLAKPRHTSSDLTYARHLDEVVRATVESLPLSTYGAGFHWALTGAFKKKLEQAGIIGADVGTVSWVAMLLVLLLAFAHFRSAGATALALVPVGVGVLWTYAAAAVMFGQVSLLTACLGAILGGLGVEHGMHLVSSYGGLRDAGKSSREAVAETFGETGTAALTSALVAAVAFAALAISDFRAFREFGLLAAAGIVLVFGAFVAVLPASLGLAASRGWRPVPGAATRPSTFLAHVQRSPWGWAAVATVLVLGGVALAPKVRFVADFQTLEDTSLPAYELDQRVNRLLGYAQNPSIVPTAGAHDERIVADALRSRAAGNPHTAIDFVATLGDLVPDQQQEKLAVIARLREAVHSVPASMLAAVAPSSGWEKMLAPRAFERRDLPESIRRWFGRGDGGGVLVFPRVRSTDGDGIRNFAHELRDALAPYGGRYEAAGEALVLADILSLVVREGPRVGLVVIVVTLALLAWMLGSIVLAVMSLLPTILSLAVLAGLLPLAGLSLDFLNVIVVPVLLGTTVDAGVHLTLREGSADPNELFGSIAGGLLTNGAGFGALLVASHPGLQSIGRLASLGFAVNALIVLVAVPAISQIVKRIKDARMAPDEEEATEG